ncbi:MAG: hypothetical protein ACI8R4_004337 [Paracoccaceae bacterium]|jgi:hypothetical protein
MICCALLGASGGAVCPPIAGDPPPRIFEVRKSWGAVA